MNRPITRWAVTRREFARLGVGSALLLLWPTNGHAARDVVAEYPWLQAWVESGEFDRQWLNTLLADMEPDERVLRLMDKQAEAKPYHEYRKLFLTRSAVNRGREMALRHHALLERVENRFGAPSEILLALWWIESRYGRSMGGFPVLRALFTLSSAYPRRAEFFQNQMREFLLLCREEGWSPEAPLGSFAGAMAQVQMIPSTLRRYAVDFDGDGKRDVFHNPADVTASIANFLKGHGWIRDGLYTLPVVSTPAMESLVSPTLDDMPLWRTWQEKGVQLAGDLAPPMPEEPAGLIMLEGEDGPRYHMAFTNFKVVTQWNRSRRFAMVVRELATMMRQEIGRVGSS